jgi:hypothetical protein
MLLLHGLSHISLGHTRLYPRMTPPTTSRSTPSSMRDSCDCCCTPAWTRVRCAELLLDCYAADEWPVFVLRPPPGWPEHADWMASARQ